MKENRKETMGSWNGIADCPKCGGKGTMLVHGETSTLEIDGCWVCGYGREIQGQVAGFMPLQHLRVERRRPGSAVTGG
jgi:hypothetical protein